MALKRPAIVLPSAAMVAAGGVTAFATGEWWIVPIGVVAALLFWAFSPKPTDELPPGLDKPHRERATRLLQTRDKLLAELDSASPAIKDNLAVPAIHIRDLAKKFFALVARHQELEQFLDPAAEQQAKGEYQRLHRLVGSTNDPVARDRYLAALSAQEAQLKSREELRRSLARLDGELSTIQASLESVTVQIMRMKSAQARSSFESDTGQVAKVVRELTTEIDTVTSSIEEVFAGGEPVSGPRERVR